MTRFLTRRPTRSVLSPPFSLVDDRLSKLMEDVFEEPPETGWMPAVEVTDSEDEVVLTAETPGLTREDVKIDLEGDVLRIHGEKREETEREEENGKYRISERRYGAFSRTFTLPASVDAEHVAAEMKNGVLTVRLPKTETARGRRIEIEGD